MIHLKRILMSCYYQSQSCLRSSAFETSETCETFQLRVQPSSQVSASSFGFFLLKSQYPSLMSCCYQSYPFSYLQLRIFSLSRKRSYLSLICCLFLLFQAFQVCHRFYQMQLRHQTSFQYFWVEKITMWLSFCYLHLLRQDLHGQLDQRVSCCRQTKVLLNYPFHHHCHHL